MLRLLTFILLYKKQISMKVKILIMFLFTSTLLSAQSGRELSRVNIYNEFDSLKEVFVGTADTLYFPGSYEIETEEKATGLIKFLSKFIYPMLKGKKVPNWLAGKYRKEEESLLKVLEEYSVVVHRPDNVIPQADEPQGLGQMYARDPIISVGNVTLNSRLQIPMRQKENRGFAALLDSMSANGVRVESLTDENSFLEGGDVIVNYPYIFVGQGKYASNEKGIAWLKGIVGDQFEIVPVTIADSSVLHLDCAMTIIGQNRGIIHRGSLQDPLPYPLSEYEFIEVDEKTAKELGTNILMLNPTTIVVQKRHKKLIAALEELNYTVVPLDFTWHARLGGSFRCATSPIYRH